MKIPTLANGSYVIERYRYRGGMQWLVYIVRNGKLQVIRVAGTRNAAVEALLASTEEQPGDTFNAGLGPYT